MITTPGYYGVLAPDVCESDDLIDCIADDIWSEGKCDDSVASRILASVNATISDNTILLDTAASESLFKNKNLVRRLHQTDSVTFDGVNSESEPIYTCEAGYSVFGKAMVSNKAVGNVLSFANVVDEAYRVDYDKKMDRFEVQPKLEGATYYFERDKITNLYSCGMGKYRRQTIAVETVSENLKKYTKREVKQARLAREYVRRSNFISEGQLIKAINMGKIQNCEISSQDVLRSIDIWGKHQGNLRGKTTARKLPAVLNEIPVTTTTENQSLHIDIMYLNDEPYLIGLFQPLELAVAKKLKSKSKYEQWRALEAIISHVAPDGVKVWQIRCDGERSIDSQFFKQKLTGEKYSGIELDITGGRSSVNDVERKIRTVKERMRGVINTLPFKLFIQLEDWLLQSSLYFINLIPTSNVTDGRSPTEKLRGKTLDAKTDLKLGYGDYCEVSDDETDNTMASRSRGALALMPTGNRQGSWYFYLLSTGKVVRRNKATPLPMPENVIDFINKKAENEIAKGRRVGKDGLNLGTWDTAYIASDSDGEEEEESQDETALKLPNRIKPIADLREDTRSMVDEVDVDDPVELYADDIISDPISTDDLIREIFGEDSDTENDDVPQEQQNESPGEEKELAERVLNDPDEERFEQTENTENRYNLRKSKIPEGAWRGAAVAEKRAFGLNMTIRQGIDKTGDDAVASVVDEIVKLCQLDTFEGADIRDLTPEQIKGILPSKSFLKEKFLSSGDYDRTRSRLVAGGHRQDRTVYDNGGSPTAATQSVFMVAAIAASEGRAVATVDFPSAFLNSVLPDDYPPIYMRLGKFESRVLVQYDPTYQQFMNKDGSILVRLKRALYGCVESARLWYEHISANLVNLGFVRNSADICVFNRRESDWSQTTIALHVDDMKITSATEESLDLLINQLESVYPGLSVKRGRVFDYLGMTFDYSIAGKVKITMSGYVKEILTTYESITGVATTPAGNNLFMVNDKSTLLLNVEKEYYHSLTAKLLYLGKRVRPDILTAISFLSKRVQAPTEQDLRKLQRVVQYIRGTADKGIILESNHHLSVLAYVDSSFGVHEDFKSHTGCVIGIGLGPVYAKSNTQKLNTKSSTEAELVGLSDSTTQVIWTRTFLIEQGYSVDAATIYQDNMSTMALVKNGTSNSARTRHIAIRYFFVADRVKSGEIKVQYMPTGEMLADILTKPLQGQLFQRLRDQLLNWYD